VSAVQLLKPQEFPPSRGAQLERLRRPPCVFSHGRRRFFSLVPGASLLAAASRFGHSRAPANRRKLADGPSSSGPLRARASSVASKCAQSPRTSFSPLVPSPAPEAPSGCGRLARCSGRPELCSLQSFADNASGAKWNSRHGGRLLQSPVPKRRRWAPGGCWPLEGLAQESADRSGIAPSAHPRDLKRQAEARASITARARAVPFSRPRARRACCVCSRHAASPI
jgi:hypothetical protein